MKIKCWICFGVWSRLESAGAVIFWPSQLVLTGGRDTAAMWIFDPVVTITFSVVVASSSTVSLSIGDFSEKQHIQQDIS